VALISQRGVMRADARAVLFWSVCIPLRLMIARHASRQLGPRAAAAVIGGRWVSGLENGNEGMFGGPAWWADERRAHGVLWLLYAASGDRMWLCGDVMFGAANWLHKSSSALSVRGAA